MDRAKRYVSQNLVNRRNKFQFQFISLNNKIHNKSK